MRWKQGRRSSNVEDRRGQRMPGGPLGMVRGPIKIGGGLGLLILLAVVLLGGDPFGGGGEAPGPAPAPTTQPGTTSAAEDELAAFSETVLAYTEDTWGPIFRESGLQYRPPTLVLFTDATSTACGYGSAATGPFYCPPDERLYIDLGFFSDLSRMAGIESNEFDFAGAYVISHEVGHHVQNLLGTSNAVRQLQARNPNAANQLSVLMELQADCFAGVIWSTRNRPAGSEVELLPGDAEEGMRTAAAIGDDRLMRSAGRAVSPESFTHGTSDQRREWLRRGLDSGDPDQCDTFGQAGYD